MLTTLFAAGCATPADRLGKAGATKADARLVDQALEAARASAKADLPPMPAECRRTERVEVKAGDRLDVVVVRYDAALTRVNGRIEHCGAWYDGQRRARNER